MNGFLLINKPEDYTSRDIVNIISKKFNTKKVGHAGTLDPLATGVLVVAIGRYTKLIDILSGTEKEYIAEMMLGIETDTLDITGNVIAKKDYDVTKDDILKSFKKFIGVYHMEVPIYSAVKINGKKLYQYAREKQDIELPVKDVEIKSLELISFNNNIVKFKTKVSKGTYIRSLIRDIGYSLNTVATMNSLVRIKQSIFSIDETCSLNDLENDKYNILDIRNIFDVLEYQLNQDEYKKVINGNNMNINVDKEYVLFCYMNEDIALYKKENDIFKIKVMIKVN